MKNRIVKAFLSAMLISTVLFSGVGNVVALADTTTVKTDGYENEAAIDLTKIGSYVSGTSNSDGGVAEIISYDSKNNNAWVVNGVTGKIDILSLSDVTCGVSGEMKVTTLDVKSLVEGKAEGFTYGDMTSVSVNSDLGIVAVALQAEAHDANGYVAILTTEGEFVAMFEAGYQPDMVTFTPDGSKILVANEGEPREGYGEGIVDPAGSVTVVTVNKNDVAKSSAVTIGFEQYDNQRDALVEAGVILGKYEDADGNMVKLNPSTDFEPEYISATNTTAYIALQEANAIAVLDLESNTYIGVYSLGYKDLSLEANAIDLIEDGEYKATTYPDAVGAYMPDGIAVYEVNGQTYVLTANEGDAREWGDEDEGTDYCNEIKEKIKNADGEKTENKVRVIDPELTDGLPEGKSVLFGGRSFSMYRVDANGLTQVFDSANDLEEMTAAYIPDYFNCSNDDEDIDSRSPKKGVEPESVTVGTVDGKTYAFVALERIGGIMVYDITDASNVTYCNYINTRDFSESSEDLEPGCGTSLTGDVAPEGLYFISAENSPSGTPILLAAFEVSGTVAAYAVGSEPAGHSYATEWSYDAETHWHEASCSHDVTVEKVAHEYGTDNVCDTCGYEKVVVDNNGSNNENGTGNDVESDNDNIKDDNNINVSKTADTHNVIGWTAIGVFGLVGILVAVVSKRKSRD